MKFCKIALKQNHRLILYLGDLESIQQFKCSFRFGNPFGNFLVNADGTRRYLGSEFFRLHYVTLNDEIVDELFTLMPSITHLEVVISQVNIYLISLLICLLTHWASTLKWLKVCAGEFRPEDSQLLHAIIRAINSRLSVLEHLTLDLDGPLFPFVDFQSIAIRHHGEIPRQFLDQQYLHLPILGQLKEFFIQTRDNLHLRHFCDTIEQQASDQLTVIGLGLPFTWENNLNSLISHPLAACFKLLATQYEPPFSPTSFPNLHGFTAHWHLNQPLNFLTSKLVSLEHLQYLELRRLSHKGKVPVDPAELSPLPSVEVLRINFNSFNLANDHTLLQDDHWASLFPSVQIVNLIHSGDFCVKCYPKEEDSSDNPPGFEQTRWRLFCLSQLIAPLTVLPSLRKIFYQRNDDLKNIAEFTGNGAFVKTHAYIY